MSNRIYIREGENIGIKDVGDIICSQMNIDIPKENWYQCYFHPKYNELTYLYMGKTMKKDRAHYTNNITSFHIEDVQDIYKGEDDRITIKPKTSFECGIDIRHIRFEGGDIEYPIKDIHCRSTISKKIERARENVRLKKEE